MIVRSDNISSLTTEGIQAMWEYGVQAIVDLRSEQEIAKRPSQFEPPDFGPRYLHVPLIDDDFAEKLSNIPAMADRYREMLDHRQDAIASVMTSIARVDGPVVFHCFAGKDRTGLVAALLLSLVGVDDQAIGADYAETDSRLAERYEEWIAAAAPERIDAVRDELRCPPEWMIGALEHVRTWWGGPEAYLLAGGTDPADVVRLKVKLAG